LPTPEVEPVQDDEIVQRITELADREHKLRGRVHSGDGLDDDGREQLERLEVQLDQCWDLLRQRRARREYASDPDEAELRDPAVVERYQQ
jgi:hypothetical protein